MDGMIWRGRNFESPFMVGLYELCTNDRMEEIVLGHFLNLVLGVDRFGDREKLKRLLSTDDDEYLDDIRQNLLLPLNQKLGKTDAGLRSSDDIRKLFRGADLGWGNGRRLTDRVQHLVQSLIHRDFGIEIQARQIAEGHPYLLCMDHWDFKGFSDVGGNQVDGSGLCDSGMDQAASEVVQAYASSIVYRLSATRMKNNHGTDSLALICLDEKVIRRFPKVAAVLRRERHPFRIVFCEYKTGDGRHRLPFFKKGAGSSFGAGAFSSYADELSNVARQVNAMLRKAGIGDKLETISLYQADPVNWDHSQMLDLSNVDLYSDGYRRVLENPKYLKLGEKLNAILEGQSSLKQEIIDKILRPHMAIRQALADASTIEEFFATGRHFRFNPARIGYKGKRDGHIILHAIDPEDPPLVEVVTRNSSIILHPAARKFRQKGGRLVFGFEMSDGMSSPYLLQEEEIVRMVHEELIPYLKRIWKITRDLRQKGWRNLPINERDQAQIRRFMEAKDLKEALLLLEEGHIINFFRQAIQKRLFMGNLRSLQINGNRYSLFKVVVGWGSRKFLEQLQVMCDAHAQNACRYDQVVVTLKERLRYGSSKNRRKRKAKPRKRASRPFSREQALRFIAGEVGIQLEEDGQMAVVPRSGFPFTGPFFERHDLEGHLRMAVQGLLRSANLSFSHGPDFLRFPLAISRGQPSFALRMVSSGKASWDQLDRCVRFQKRDARHIQNLNHALKANLHDPQHFQAVVELGRFGIAKTQLGSVYGILDEWLDPASREEIDRIAFQTANDWDRLMVENVTGQRRKSGEIGIVERDGRTIKINGRNRILWFLEGVLGGKEEPEVRFREDCLPKVKELCGLPQHGMRLSQMDLFSKRRLSIPVFRELFARQHKIEEEAYDDVLQILLHKTKVRYQRNGHEMRPILHAEEEEYRRGQLGQLATVFTPSNVFFAPSGRAIAAEVSLRRDAQVSIHQTSNGFPIVDLILNPLRSL